VNEAIGRMDQVVQQNAVMVEQAAAASGALESQAGKLFEVVSIFRLKDMPATRVAAPVATRAAVAKRAAPALAARAARPSAAAPQSRQAVPAGGDDWEEF
jgi:methyl-accepting chemotaxis protein